MYDPFMPQAEARTPDGTAAEHSTSAPADWPDRERAEYRQCEAEAADIQSQMQDREDSYERGDITWAEYQSWEFDYGPRDPDDEAAPEPPEADEADATERAGRDSRADEPPF